MFDFYLLVHYFFSTVKIDPLPISYFWQSFKNYLFHWRFNMIFSCCCSKKLTLFHSITKLSSAAHKTCMLCLLLWCILYLASWDMFTVKNKLWTLQNFCCGLVDTFILPQLNFTFFTRFTTWELLLPQPSSYRPHHTITILWPFFRDHPGVPAPEENLRTSGL